MARILKDWPAVSLKAEELNGKIDFVRIFGRKRPVHIEVGSGRATFLVNQAAAQPQVNFLGIERAGKYYRYAVDRIGRHSLSNVRIIRADAAAFIADFVPDSSVVCFHIYFPDPWPKRRHHKRRLFNHANLEQLLRCLKPNGLIKVATDHPGYFEQIENVVSEGMNAPSQTGRLEQVQFLPTAGAATGERVGTNFERKYLNERRPIYTIAVRKI